MAPGPESMGSNSIELLATIGSFTCSFVFFVDLDEHLFSAARICVICGFDNKTKIFGVNYKT